MQSFKTVPFWQGITMNSGKSHRHWNSFIAKPWMWKSCLCFRGVKKHNEWSRHFFLPKQIRTIVKNFYCGERRPSNRTMTSPKNGEKMFFIISWRVLNILQLVKTRFNWGNEMARRFQNFLSRRNSSRIKTGTIFEMPEVIEFSLIPIKFRPSLFFRSNGHWLLETIGWWNEPEPELLGSSFSWA